MPTMAGARSSIAGQPSPMAAVRRERGQMRGEQPWRRVVEQRLDRNRATDGGLQAGRHSDHPGRVQASIGESGIWVDRATCLIRSAPLATCLSSASLTWRLTLEALVDAASIIVSAASCARFAAPDIRPVRPSSRVPDAPLVPPPFPVVAAEDVELDSVLWLLTLVSTWI